MEVEIPIKYSKKRAAAIGAKFAKKYPYKEYGRLYLKRGTQQSLGQFGPSWKLADAAQRQNRREYGFVGRGKYMRGRGGYWGRALGNLFGMGDAGDKLGDVVSSGLSGLGGKWGRKLAGLADKTQGIAKSVADFTGSGIYVGNGMYKSIDNSIIAGDTLPVPHFTGEKDGASVVISHREYISDVYAPPTTTSFANQVYDINPGLERSFPWLSQIAANYEEYEIKQLIYTYRSTVADFAAATGQVGQVLMATQYNSNREPFYEKITMMQYDGAMSGKTSQTQMHGVECDPAKLSGNPGKYVRVSPVLSDQDKNDYDHAQFNIAVADVPTGYANQSIGELWVSYTIELRKPKFFTGRGLAISRDNFVGISSSVSLPFDSTSVTNNLRGQQNNIGCLLDRNYLNPVTGATVTRLVFPATFAGNVRIRIRVTSVGFTPTGPTALYSMLPTTTGNVGGIDDQAIGNPVTWFNVRTATEQISGSLSFINESHWRVGVATGGVDNTIMFEVINPGSVSSSGLFAEMDISEYNIGLNYNLNGSNDEIKYVDPNGVVVNI